MKIVTKNDNGAVVMVADCPTDQWTSGQYTVHNLPDWDWSLADTTGVDRTQKNWVYCWMQWNGITLVPRTTPLPQPYS